MNTKNFLSTAAFIMLSVSVVTSCSKNDDENINIGNVNEQPQSVMKVYTLSVGAVKGGDGSTRALTSDGSTVSATWTTGDLVQVYDSDDNNLGTLTAQSSGAITSLTGDITVASLSEGDVLTLKYLSANYSLQVGTLEDIAANCDYATATVTITEIDGSTVSTTDASFENQQAICKFTLSQNVTDLRIYYGTAMISVTPALVTNEVYVALPSTGEKTNYTFMGITSDGGIYIAQKKANLTNGKYYNTSVAMTEETRVVDLGLSVKWATMNVGATTVTGYGYIFEWGGTTGYSSSDTSDHDFTTYGLPGINGDIDLPMENDAAFANMGKNWRMPTRSEMHELASTDNCTWEWTNDYNDTGIAGYTVTSKKAGYTGNSIFLPAVGYRLGTSLYEQGTNGYYWTASVSESALGTTIWLVEHLEFSSSSIKADYAGVLGNAAYGGTHVYCGFPLRAVIRQ